MPYCREELEILRKKMRVLAYMSGGDARRRHAFDVLCRIRLGRRQYDMIWTFDVSRPDV